MVYKCFKIYLLWYRVYLDCLQVQLRSGETWRFWSLLRCRTAQTRQMSIYGWRHSHHYIEHIFWHKIELWVSFLMPPVWGQSASCSRGYSRFIEEWSVCLARGSCREEERMSIDAELLTLIDMDARTWAKHISRPFETQKPHQVTKILMDDQKPYLCISKPLLTATLSIILFYCLLLGLERRSILLQRLIGTPLVLSLISYLLYYSDYDLCYCLHVWVIYLVRFRDFMSLMSNW